MQKRGFRTVSRCRRGCWKSTSPLGSRPYSCAARELDPAIACQAMIPSEFLDETVARCLATVARADAVRVR